jgi:hypothetical protein
MPNSKSSRSPSARKERAAIRRYLAATLAFINVQAGDDPEEIALVTQRFANAHRALSRIPGYKADDPDVTCCTPGHAADCLTSEHEACECACGGKNHGKLRSTEAV